MAKNESKVFQLVNRKLSVEEVARLINQKIAGEKGKDWNLKRISPYSYVVLYFGKKKVYVPRSWFKFRNKRPVSIIIEKLERDYNKKSRNVDTAHFRKYNIYRLDHSDPFGRV